MSENLLPFSYHLANESSLFQGSAEVGLTHIIVNMLDCI